LRLDLLGHGVRRDGLELRLTEAARQPQTPLPVVGDVCPEAENVAALRLGAVVAGGSLKIAERALGVGPVAMIAASVRAALSTCRPQASSVPARSWMSSICGDRSLCSAIISRPVRLTPAKPSKARTFFGCSC